MSLPETCTQSNFAIIIGKNTSWVTQLKQAGRLVLTEDGKKIRVRESLDLLAATEDPSKAGVAERHAAARGAATTAPASNDAAAADDEPDDVPNNPHSLRRAAALADKEEALARKAARDEQLELGQLLRANDVEHAVRGAVATFRQTIERLPATLSPELASLSDESRIRVVLAEALDYALEELSRAFAVIGRGAEA